MNSEATNEHLWLQQLIGDWRSEGHMAAQPGNEAAAQPVTWESRESVRAIGELWIQAEGHSTMPDGSPAITQMTLGYDPQKQRFVGTWLGSMMSYLWIYEGELDAAGRILTLNTTGPGMSRPGEMAAYQDVIELKSAEHRVLTSHRQDDQGNWHQFMIADYYRV